MLSSMDMDEAKSLKNEAISETKSRNKNLNIFQQLSKRTRVKASPCFLGKTEEQAMPATVKRLQKARIEAAEVLQRRFRQCKVTLLLLPCSVCPRALNGEASPIPSFNCPWSTGVERSAGEDQGAPRRARDANPGRGARRRG